MRHSQLVLLAALTGLAAQAEAQEDEPDLGFLEYLGSWQDGDEDWLVVAGIDEDRDEHDRAAAKDDAPVQDEATDESDETDETDQK